MLTFVIIFHQQLPLITPQERQTIAHEITAWAQRLNGSGHKLDARILGPDVAWRSQDGNKPVAGEMPVTALLFLEARDLDEAAQIAASHPALRYRAHVEIRPWSPPAAPAAPAPAQ